MTAKQKKLLGLILTVVIPPVIAALVAWALLRWHIQTRIGFEVLTKQVQFTVGRSGQNKAVPILDSMSFPSLAVENFSGIRFTPEEIFVADPKQYDLVSNSYPASAWEPLLPRNAQVEIKALGHEQDPRITLESAPTEKPDASRLDGLRAGPGTVVKWGTGEEGQLILKLSNNTEQAAVSVVLPGVSQIVADHISLEGVDKQPYSGQSLTYRVRLPDADPAIEISGWNNSLTIIAHSPRARPLTSSSSDQLLSRR